MRSSSLVHCYLNPGDPGKPRGRLVVTEKIFTGTIFIPTSMGVDDSRIHFAPSQVKSKPDDGGLMHVDGYDISGFGQTCRP